LAGHSSSRPPFVHRFLARLAVAALGRWVLKGALALDYRVGERTRTTKDIDLVRTDNEEVAPEDLIAAQHVDLAGGRWDPEKGTWRESES
jgi:hypothetical protein